MRIDGLAPSAGGDPGMLVRAIQAAHRRGGFTLRAATVVLLLAAARAAPASAQTVAGIMSGLRDGGGWVGIPIEDGEGTYTTIRLPTARMTLSGCVNVWYGHSGTWTIEARDQLTDSTLIIDAEPGIAVPFSHTFGMQAKLDFDFEWSEPRDTTLYLWVGVDTDGEGGEPPKCYPS
jgi:hypothetical protein